MSKNRGRFLATNYIERLTEILMKFFSLFFFLISNEATFVCFHLRAGVY